MKRPGQYLSCPYCDERHIVKEDENGFSPSVSERKFYVECSSLDGNIYWAVLSDV